MRLESLRFFSVPWLWLAAGPITWVIVCSGAVGSRVFLLRQYGFGVCGGLCRLEILVVFGGLLFVPGCC